MWILVYKKTLTNDTAAGIDEGNAGCFMELEG